MVGKKPTTSTSARSIATMRLRFAFVISRTLLFVKVFLKSKRRYLSKYILLSCIYIVKEVFLLLPVILMKDTHKTANTVYWFELVFVQNKKEGRESVLLTGDILLFGVYVKHQIL